MRSLKKRHFQRDFQGISQESMTEASIEKSPRLLALKPEPSGHMD